MTRRDVSTGARPSGQAQTLFQPLGRHRVSVSEELIWFIAEGGLDMQETLQLTELCHQIGERYGYVLVLVDAHKAQPASPESRRYQVENLRQRFVTSHSAIYGANVVVTAFISLYHRAVELLLHRVPPVSYHQDEASARARLVSEREILRRELTQSPEAPPSH
jgi:hypothetical protein